MVLTKSQRYFLNAAIVIELILSQILNVPYKITNAVIYNIHICPTGVVSPCMETM